METPVHFVAQAFFGEYGNQGDVNYYAYGQYDRRPAYTAGTVVKPSYQQLEKDAEYGNFYKKIQGAGQYVKWQFARKQGKQLYQAGDHDNDWKSELKKPSGIISKIGDKIKIYSDCGAVCEKREVNGAFAVNHCRKSKEKQAYAYPDDHKRPEGALEYKQIQKQACN